MRCRDWGLGGSLSVPTDAQGCPSHGWGWGQCLELTKTPHTLCMCQSSLCPLAGTSVVLFSWELGSPALSVPQSWPAASPTSTLLQPFPGPGIMKDSKIIFVLAELHWERNGCPWPGKKLNFAAGSFFFPFPIQTGSAASPRQMGIFLKDSLVFPVWGLQQNCSHTGCTVRWKMQIPPHVSIPNGKGPQASGLLQITSMHAEFAA